MCVYISLVICRLPVGCQSNILKGYPGEASEKGGRLCIAVPAGEAAGALFVLSSIKLRSTLL
jgi:hypothetical protein